jgi:hypothetical protein
MNETAKKFLERSAYVVFFLVAFFAVRAYRESRKPSAPPTPVDAMDTERARKQEEFRKTIEEYDAKQAAGHAARVRRLGEEGAKAEENRCEEELRRAFESSVGDKKSRPPDMPDCDK